MIKIFEKTTEYKNASHDGEAKGLRLREMSQNLKSVDSLSISQISPDWYPGIRFCFTAFRSVERSIACSTLSSLIVFMFISFSLYKKVGRRLAPSSLLGEPVSLHHCLGEPVLNLVENAGLLGVYQLVISLQRCHLIGTFVLLRETALWGRRVNRVGGSSHLVDSFVIWLLSGYPLGTLLLNSAIAEFSRGFDANFAISEKLVGGGIV